MKLRPEQLSDHLKKQLSPLYLISGDDILLIQNCLDEIRVSAKAKGFDEIQRIDITPQTDWDHLRENLYTGSLFSNQRIILLRFPELKISKPATELLLEYIQNISANILLLIQLPKLDSTIQRSALYKAIETQGVHIAIWPLEAGRLLQWIRQELAKKQIQFAPEVPSLIADYSAGNLLATYQIIEKLALTFPNEFISNERLLSSISDHSHYSVFELVDQSLLGNTTLVLKILDNLHKEDTEPTLILWALTKELRILIDLAFQMQQGKAWQQASSELKLWEQKKLAIKKCIDRHTLDEFYKLLADCHIIDKAIKGFGTEPLWLLFERCFLELASKGKQ